MQRLQKLSRGLVMVGAVIYALSMIILTLLWLFLPDLHWTISFTNIFAALFFVPLLILLPLALIWRTRLIAVSAIVPLLLFGLLFGGRFIPHTLAAPAGGTTLRVVSFNQLVAVTDTSKIIETIRAQNADLVALQELSEPVSKQIEAELKTMYPYQILDPSNSSGGSGMLSRYPLDDAGDVEGTRAKRAILHFNGKDITIVNVHLHFSGISRVRRAGGLDFYRLYDTSGRVEQAQALLQESQKASAGLIMLGDHNTGDREPGYQILDADLHDAFAETGWGLGFTFPNNKRMGPITIPVPLVRIDYIWSKGGITPLSAQVDCHVAGSDHCLLRADLHVAP